MGKFCNFIVFPYFEIFWTVRKQKIQQGRQNCIRSVQRIILGSFFSNFEGFYNSFWIFSGKIFGADIPTAFYLSGGAFWAVIVFFWKLCNRRYRNWEIKEKRVYIVRKWFSFRNILRRKIKIQIVGSRSGWISVELKVLQTILPVLPPLLFLIGASWQNVLDSYSD